MDKDKFYQEMEKELEKRNMSRRELAKKVGITASTLKTMIERKSDVKVGIYHRICRELELYPRTWPLDGREIGPELIGPQVGIDDDERGPVLAVTLMPLETVIGYAIEGIKDHASKIGLKLTDKTMSEHDLDNAIGELRCLHNAWLDLEVERAEIQKAVEGAKHGNG